MASNHEAGLLRQAMEKVDAGNAEGLSAEERNLLRRVYARLQGDPQLNAFEEGLTSAELWALERGYDLTSHLSDEELRGDLNGTLPAPEAKTVQAHLATCAACRAESEDILETRQAVQRAQARRDAAKTKQYASLSWIRRIFGLVTWRL